jgi:hypothetical protein
VLTCHAERSRGISLGAPGRRLAPRVATWCPKRTPPIPFFQTSVSRSRPGWKSGIPPFRSWPQRVPSPEGRGWQPVVGSCVGKPSDESARAHGTRCFCSLPQLAPPVCCAGAQDGRKSAGRSGWPECKCLWTDPLWQTSEPVVPAANLRPPCVAQGRKMGARRPVAAAGPSVSVCGQTLCGRPWSSRSPPPTCAPRVLRRGARWAPDGRSQRLTRV